ncbi:hypothetical protein KC350_g64 [Hortaea werneckii]|nr:hypothetical protein KC350_g64 [Hortaea werneckii]
MIYLPALCVHTLLDIVRLTACARASHAAHAAGSTSVDCGNLTVGAGRGRDRRAALEVEIAEPLWIVESWPLGPVEVEIAEPLIMPAPPAPAVPLPEPEPAAPPVCIAPPAPP